MQAFVIVPESTLQSEALYAFLTAFKIPFSTQTLTEDEKQIKASLYEKYVTTGLWAKMSAEAQEDAAMGEMIEFTRAKKNSYLSQKEKTDFLTYLNNL